MTHGERVKVIRNSLGLTLQSFGRPLGVTKTAICNIEKGNPRPHTCRDSLPVTGICRFVLQNHIPSLVVPETAFPE